MNIYAAFGIYCDAERVPADDEPVRTADYKKGIVKIRVSEFRDGSVTVEENKPYLTGMVGPKQVFAGAAEPARKFIKKQYDICHTCKGER